MSGSFQGFDQNHLIDSLKKLGPSFVGVTQLSVIVKKLSCAQTAEFQAQTSHLNFELRGKSSTLYS